MAEIENSGILLEKIKLDIGLEDGTNDDYLLQKIGDSLLDIKMYIDPTYHNISHVPTDIINVTIQKLVVLYFNKRGLEGTGYFSEGGLTFSYKEKNEALADLTSYRKPSLVNIRSGVSGEI